MSNASRSTVAILGVPFHNVTMDETVTFIEDRIRQGGFHQIATANVDFLRNALHDKDLRNILCSCDMVVPDGMPIVWMSQFARDRLERTCQRDRSGGKTGGGFSTSRIRTFPARSQRNALRRVRPKLCVNGIPNCVSSVAIPPSRSRSGRWITKKFCAGLRRRVQTFCWWLLEIPSRRSGSPCIENRLQVPVCIGVGGTIDFLSGTVARAPRWMQRSGMEWAHRTVQEPNRLLVRYSADALCLMRYLPAYFAASVAQPLGTFQLERPHQAGR